MTTKKVTPKNPDPTPTTKANEKTSEDRKTAHGSFRFRKTGSSRIH